MSDASRPVLLLCAGLQSSGSSLISWCFLQRADTNGVFDANGDMVVTPPPVDTPYCWYKATISGFSLTEQAQLARDAGYDVRPLLIVRDVRVVWSSLSGKRYGINGTTAEDPPLRTRMRRFLKDWRTFGDAGWPILAYEQFVRDPEHHLQRTCDALKLPWDQGMIDWPKSSDEIANTVHGNATFTESAGDNLLASLKPEAVDQVRNPIGAEDLAWLEKTFAEFNQAHGYPAHREIPAAEAPRAIPSFQGTRRMKWRLHQKPLKHLAYKLGLIQSIKAPGER